MGAPVVESKQPALSLDDQLELAAHHYTEVDTDERSDRAFRAARERLIEAGRAYADARCSACQARRQA